MRTQMYMRMCIMYRGQLKRCTMRRKTKRCHRHRILKRFCLDLEKVVGPKVVTNYNLTNLISRTLKIIFIRFITCTSLIFSTPPPFPLVISCFFRLPIRLTYRYPGIPARPHILAPRHPHPHLAYSLAFTLFRSQAVHPLQ